MGMFDYVKVSRELNVPGSGSSTAVWQTKNGPCEIGLFKLSAEGCLYFNGLTMGSDENKPVFKLLNEDLYFYRLEGGRMAEYMAKIRDGDLISIICLEDSKVIWEKS